MYASQILGIKWFAFYREMLPIAATTLAVAGLGWMCAAWLSVDSWHTLIFAATSLGVVALGFIFGVVLDSRERQYAVRTLWPHPSESA